MLKTSGRLQYIRFEQRYRRPPTPSPHHEKSPRIQTNLPSRPGRGWGVRTPGPPRPAPRLRDAAKKLVFSDLLDLLHFTVIFK